MTRKTFAALCAKHGVAWKIETWDPDTIHVDPPAGKVFADTGLHFISFWLKGWKRADAYAEIASDLAGGVEPCGENECEYCSDSLADEPKRES